MRVRRMDIYGDMIFGHNQADFWNNVPDAVGQVVGTRLRLLLGEFFIDTSEGTDWANSVLGKYTANLRDAVLRARILGTPGVNSLIEFTSSFDGNTRAYTVNCLIDTIYGTARVTETI